MSKRIILVGPSASGKNYIREQFVQKGYKADCSYTTRQPRTGEVDGIDYKFISREDFQDRLILNCFYEWVKYGDNLYATGKKEWEECDIFIMETQGVKHIKPEDRKESLIIFVNTPFNIRVKRMMNRGWDETKIKQRIKVDEFNFGDFIDFDIEISSNNEKENSKTNYFNKFRRK